MTVNNFFQLWTRNLFESELLKWSLKSSIFSSSVLFLELVCEEEPCGLWEGWEGFELFEDDLRDFWEDSGLIIWEELFEWGLSILIGSGLLTKWMSFKVGLLLFGSITMDFCFIWFFDFVEVEVDFFVNWEWFNKSFSDLSSTSFW